MKDRKKVLLQYSITTLICAGTSFMILYMNGFWRTFDLAEKYKLLADAFTIPGILLIMVAALVWVSSEGFFDGISYAVTQFSGMIIPSIGKKYKHMKYYDYKMEKKEKRSGGYSFLFFVGLLFTVIAVVFVILFNQVYVPKI